MTSVAQPKISAFPKCYLEEISERRMSVFDWIEQAKELDCDGLEMYEGFFERLDESYLLEIRSAINAAGASPGTQELRRGHSIFASRFAGEDREASPGTEHFRSASFSECDSANNTHTLRPLTIPQAKKVGRNLVN